jgi:hypothetical protein
MATEKSLSISIANQIGSRLYNGLCFLASALEGSNNRLLRNYADPVGEGYSI